MLLFSPVRLGDAFKEPRLKISRLIGRVRDPTHEARSSTPRTGISEQLVRLCVWLSEGQTKHNQVENRLPLARSSNSPHFLSGNPGAALSLAGNRSRLASV